MMKQGDLNTSGAKVPRVILLFCITKIFLRTFGETAGDAVLMSLNLGYLLRTFIFAFIFNYICIFLNMFKLVGVLNCMLVKSFNRKTKVT